MAPPPLLLSFDSTPGAATCKGVWNGVEYASFTVVGGDETVLHV